MNNIVLENINLDIKEKMTALVGHSDPVNSLLNLIPRIYDADSGEILIDNQKIQLEFKIFKKRDIDCRSKYYTF